MLNQILLQTLALLITSIPVIPSGVKDHRNFSPTADYLSKMECL